MQQALQCTQCPLYWLKLQYCDSPHYLLVILYSLENNVQTFSKATRVSADSTYTTAAATVFKQAHVPVVLSRCMGAACARAAQQNEMGSYRIIKQNSAYTELPVLSIRHVNNSSYTSCKSTLQFSSIALVCTLSQHTPTELLVTAAHNAVLRATLQHIGTKYE
eukprot:707-Heterococcus_DN1.PRE.2